MKAPSSSARKFRNLLITKPLTFIDLETTGSILGLDRIIEIGALKVSSDGQESEFESRVNPEMKITSEATRKHGLTNADVRNAPDFAAVAPNLVEFLGSSDLAGYNILNFDLPMLQSELHRVGIPFPIKGRRLIDVMDIFVRNEPRDLKTAFRFYCGKDLDRAHLASADARACWQVLQGQIRRYRDMPDTVDGVSDYVAEHRKKRALDTGGWFITRSGKPAFARGKHQGKLIREIEELDPSYLDWMLSLGLPEDTIEVIRSVLPNFGV